MKLRTVRRRRQRRHSRTRHPLVATDNGRGDPVNYAPPMRRKTAKDFPQELLELYDYYAHGQITKREFMDRAAKFAIGGVTAAALLSQLSPD